MSYDDDLVYADESIARRRRWPWALAAAVLILAAGVGTALVVADDDDSSTRASTTASPSPSPTPEHSETAAPGESATPEETTAPSDSPTATNSPTPARAPSGSATASPRPSSSASRSSGFPPKGLVLDVVGEPITGDPPAVRFRIRVRDNDGSEVNGTIDFGDGTKQVYSRRPPASCRTTPSSPAPDYRAQPIDKTFTVTHPYETSGKFTVTVTANTARPCEGTPEENARQQVIVVIPERPTEPPEPPSPVPTPTPTPSPS